jgi:hypothetical protein
MLHKAHEDRYCSRQERSVSLRCALGYHRANGVPRWNDGYYFGRCARCGVDLVRTPFSRWHVPAGYRVVWQAEPPASRPDVKLEPELDLEPAELPNVPAPENVAPAPEPAATAAETISAPAIAAPEEEPAEAEVKRRRLPVESLLEKLRGTPGPGAALPEPVAPPAPRRATDWDFMMEPGERAFSAAQEPRRPPEPQTAAAEPAGTAVAAQPKKIRRGPSIQSRASVKLRRWAGSTFRRARHSKRLAQLAMATIILAVLATAVLVLTKRPMIESQVPGAAANMPVEVEPQNPPTEADPQSPAFVATRALSCRDAPALQARRVRVLARGTPVQLLARDGDWVSLATRFGQCWALGKYVSEPEPL